MRSRERTNGIHREQAERRKTRNRKKTCCEEKRFLLKIEWNGNRTFFSNRI